MDDDVKLALAWFISVILIMLGVVIIAFPPTGGIVLMTSLVAGLVIAGIALLSGRGTWMIAGYNTAFSEERAAFDEKELCRGVGAIMIVLSGFLALLEINLTLWSSALPTSVLVVLMLGTLGASIVYLNTARRFRKAGRS